MRELSEAHEASVAPAEQALETWEWRELEHEIWAARFAEARYFDWVPSLSSMFMKVLTSGMTVHP